MFQLSVWESEIIARFLKMLFDDASARDDLIVKGRLVVGIHHVMVHGMSGNDVTARRKIGQLVPPHGLLARCKHDVVVETTNKRLVALHVVWIDEKHGVDPPFLQQGSETIVALAESVVESEGDKRPVGTFMVHDHLHGILDADKRYALCQSVEQEVERLRFRFSLSTVSVQNMDAVGWSCTESEKVQHLVTQGHSGLHIDVHGASYFRSVSATVGVFYGIEDTLCHQFRSSISLVEVAGVASHVEHQVRLAGSFQDDFLQFVFMIVEETVVAIFDIQTFASGNGVGARHEGHAVAHTLKNGEPGLVGRDANERPRKHVA